MVNHNSRDLCAAQHRATFEFDDGSAVVGDYDDGMGVVPEVAFDGNLADVIDSAILGRIASDLVGYIDDDLSSRQDWEATYKQGLY